MFQFFVQKLLLKIWGHRLSCEWAAPAKEDFQCQEKVLASTVLTVRKNVLRDTMFTWGRRRTQFSLSGKHMHEEILQLSILMNVTFQTLFSLEWKMCFLGALHIFRHQTNWKMVLTLLQIGGITRGWVSLAWPKAEATKFFFKGFRSILAGWLDPLPPRGVVRGLPKSGWVCLGLGIISPLGNH